MLKNEVVINTEKGFTRYKFAHFRRWSKSKKLSNRGTTFYIYQYKDKIRLVRHNWDFQNKSNNGSIYITIKYRKGYFCLSFNGKVKTNFGVVGSFFNLWKNRKFGHSQLTRLQKIIKKWSEGLGHTYKTLKSATPELILSRLIWPSLQRVELDKTFKPPIFPKIKQLLRLYLSLKEIIKRVLGSCGKKTYKLVCELIKKFNISYVLDRLYILRKIFSNIDDIQTSFNSGLFISLPITSEFEILHHGISLNTLVAFIKKFSKHRLLSPSIEDFPQNKSFYIDSIRMWNQCGQPDIERGITIKEYHDKIMVEQRKRIEKDFELKPKDFLLSIDGIEIDEYTIVVPKTRYELIEWGNIMSNCIASYANSMLSGYCSLFGVKENGKLVYNIMLWSQEATEKCMINGELELIPSLSHKVSQFYGKCNSHVQPEIVKKILEALPIKIDGGNFSMTEKDRHDFLCNELVYGEQRVCEVQGRPIFAGV
jgi:hypothetical protein